ncbi:MAG: response regulator, partial [Trueperaceae bacterium]|nr:response regulator [Trueperaceae bacterium]
MSNRRTVLLVDDDPGTRHMLQYGLKKAMGAIEVVVANSGREAIGLLEHRAIDVVVTDLAMPVGDAFSLIAYMNNSRSPIPVIALSVLDSEAVAKRLASLWSLRVVQKPASYQEVAAAATEA